ncbi:glycoside hydrolase superfamily [Suillus ampliporus]|nr:glycoside hydrolase superfamily [Suillus ampliporus]
MKSRLPKKSWDRCVVSPCSQLALSSNTIENVESVSMVLISLSTPHNITDGIGCSTIRVNNTANFLAFLEELRQNPVGANLTLSAAVGLAPFFDATRNPATDVTKFAKVLDHITVMNYDAWGPLFSTVGPNAPLNHTYASSTNQESSAVSAVKAWTDTGSPTHSIRPSLWRLHVRHETLAAYPAFNALNQPLGDAWYDDGGVDVCGVYEGPGGTFDFWGLIDGGFLTERGTPAEGIYYRYDECSQTSYVYNQTSHVMISLDNTWSFAAKGKYIKKTGLRGFAMWEAGGDMLIDSIIKAVGR